MAKFCDDPPWTLVNDANFSQFFLLPTEWIWYNQWSSWGGETCLLFIEQGFFSTSSHVSDMICCHSLPPACLIVNEQNRVYLHWWMRDLPAWPSPTSVHSYGSVSPGRGKCPFNVLFFLSRRLVWLNQTILTTSVDLWWLIMTFWFWKSWIWLLL